MGADSKIEWTDATFNPVWGCTEVSPGCDNCYARTLAHRYKHDVWGPGKPRRTFGNAHWDQPRLWDQRAAREGKRLRVFCASMADVFDKNWPPGERERLWMVIEQTPNLDWQLLTKRIGNAPKMVPERWRERWPTNAWAGASIVNQEEADRDIPKLLAVPARVRFLSCEPLLGPVDLRHITREGINAAFIDDALIGFVSNGYGGTQGPRIDWVIVGGESGQRARPMHPDWARGIRDQCQAAGMPFFFKQWGEWLTPAGIGPNGPPKGKIRPAWLREDGFVREGTVPFSSEDVPHDGKVHNHRWIKCARVGKKAAGRFLDGREWSEFPSKLMTDQRPEQR